jgi:hypothetical protein
MTSLGFSLEHTICGGYHTQFRYALTRDAAFEFVATKHAFYLLIFPLNHLGQWSKMTEDGLIGNSANLVE